MYHYDDHILDIQRYICQDATASHTDLKYTTYSCFDFAAAKCIDTKYTQYCNWL